MPSGGSHAQRIRDHDDEFGAAQRKVIRERTSFDSPTSAVKLELSNCVYDPCFGELFVWRPLQRPPLPRRSGRGTSSLAAAAARGCSSSPPSDFLGCPSLRKRAHLSPLNRAEEETISSAQGALLSPPASAARRSPPRGQILPRGKGGLDDVLKNAREAQLLFHRLQDQRLRAEYRHEQECYRHALDEQQLYKRMLCIAEYQEELVNIFGPTMRDVIGDVFFDDGEDPVLTALRGRREAPRSARSSPYVPPRGSPTPTVRLGDPGLVRHSSSRAALSSSQEGHFTMRHERNVLQQALKDLRQGRRCGY